MFSSSPITQVYVLATADEDVFERVITLIEGSSSKHFAAMGESNSKPRVRDLVKVVAHRVVHGGTEAKPMVIWPRHEQGLEEMDALSAFAPLHVRFINLVRVACGSSMNPRITLQFKSSAVSARAAVYTLY